MNHRLILALVLFTAMLTIGTLLDPYRQANAEARQMLTILMQSIILIVMVMYASLFHVSITFAGLTQVKYQIQLQPLLASYPVCLHRQSPADVYRVTAETKCP